ncbi:MAG: polysaccharide biosynthesis tyrosine autokinase [Candidatus Omnitrophica bacterium]|nr:polysaccharide biosynthesis tyrosine autokinase [Candidatus Omnitrophota bacterium]MBU4457118.1 polysaccharide biosynthesis tyrosine autokinase [Candidatus Omnitrophota bacterium]
MHITKDIHIKDYINILLRRKWIVISFFLITVTTMTIATFLQKKTYKAEATVIVEVESPNVLSVKDVVKLGESNYFAYRDYIETQQEIIKSRRTAHHVIKNLKLGSREEFKKAKDPIGALLKQVKVEHIRDTRFLRISAEDGDPKLAALIANEFANVYTSSNMSLKLKMSGQARGWLKEEVETQKQKVRESELKLQNYKEENDIVSIANQDAIIGDSLTKLNTSYLAAQERRIRAETNYNSLIVIDKNGNVALENLSALFTDNPSLKKLKEDYLTQTALLVDYKKIYKYKHPKMIRLLEGMEYLRSGIKSEVDTEYKNAVQEEAKFKKAMAGQKANALEHERKIINYNVLQREVDTSERILEIVLNRLKETSIASQIQTNNVRIQDIAEIPKKPIKPKKSLNLMLAVIMGLLGGAVLAFFKEYMDVSLKDPRDIAVLLQIPVLGSVPKIKADGKRIAKKKDVDLIVEKDSNSLAAEAYRSIRTNLLFSINQSCPSKSIVITSSVPREGKTISAVNLALMLANSGERVLLVDADMRKPRVHTIFNYDNVSGLLQFLTGEKDFDSTVKYSGISNLYVATSGGTTNKPAELISSENMKRFLQNASAHYTTIIIDTPPVALVTDAALLASLCTGTILIAEGGRTTKEFLTRSKELLKNVKANILGVIVNNISLTHDSYSYPQHYYGKYYSSQAAE